MKKASVLGAGSFGTAIASVLAANFERVALWGRDEAVIAGLNAQHENLGYLPGLKLSEAVVGTTSVDEALAQTELVVVAVPAQATRAFVKAHGAKFPLGVPVVSVAKGIENESLASMTQVLVETLPASHHDAVAVLSGPSFAREMVLRMPTVVTIASSSQRTADEAQRMFQCDFFRPYTSTDVIGVQVGGALKNVIAIAAGMGDGLGLGHNARAGIITRGLAEISRIAVRMGGNPLTLSGLAGMGDLVLTCTGELSRNRKVGMELGKGRPLADILKEMKQVAEGITTAKSAKDLSVKFGVELPICEAVYSIAYEGKSAKAAALDLMGRAPKPELK